jgi:hypothetical protein
MGGRGPGTGNGSGSESEEFVAAEADAALDAFGANGVAKGGGDAGGSRGSRARRGGQLGVSENPGQGAEGTDVLLPDEGRGARHRRDDGRSGTGFVNHSAAGRYHIQLRVSSYG